MALAALVVVIACVSAGLGSVVVVVGMFVLVAGVYAARGFAHVERRRLVVLTGRPAPDLTYLRSRADDGFWRRVLTPLRDPQSWLDVVWSLVGWITATVAFSIAVAWWSTVLGGLSYWFWERFIPRDASEPQSLADMIGMGDSWAADVGLITGIAVLALVTLPFAMRFAAVVHASLASVLLTSRAELQGRVAHVEESRDSAHRAEAESLRRLERDIHDGPQQRLAPPLLVDRGLAVAVAEMADGQPIPVRVSTEIPAQLPLAVETAAYFVAAEALTNVVKHSGADRADLTLAVVEGRLEVTVDDNGCGGAVHLPGHGLAGLRERLAGVDGALFVASPAGGPTRLRAQVPLR